MNVSKILVAGNELPETIKIISLSTKLALQQIPQLILRLSDGSANSSPFKDDKQEDTALPKIGDEITLEAGYGGPSGSRSADGEEGKEIVQKEAGKGESEKSKKGNLMPKGTPYSAEFKKKIVLEVMREDNTISEIAVKHRLHPNRISTWKVQFLKSCEQVFRNSSAEERLKELEKSQNKREEDFLKQIGSDFFLV